MRGNEECSGIFGIEALDGSFTTNWRSGVNPEDLQALEKALADQSAQDPFHFGLPLRTSDSGAPLDSYQSESLPAGRKR